MLTFAADSEEDCRRWIKAFQSGASIQVQPVKTVEEIRITDLEMKKRWTSLDKDGSSQFTATPQEVFSFPFNHYILQINSHAFYNKFDLCLGTGRL